MITQTINLNLIPGGVLPRINVSQYDKGARTLQFNLYNGVTPFTIPDGSSVYVVGTKADRTGFDYEATYTGGLVSIDVTEQMTAFAGDVEIEIRIIKSGEQIATGNFVLCVERTALADDTVISETDIPIIQHLPELVAETEENAELAHKWATFGDESEEPSATNNAKYWAEQAEAAQDLTYDTATGNPVSFTTDSSGISRNTIVTLEPIQNLHGYDHPWPAGGGKNLLPMTVSGIKSANTSGSWSGDAYTIDGVTLTILSDADGNVTGINANGTASKTLKFLLHGNFLPDFGGNSITLNGCPSGGSYSSGYSLHIYNNSTQNTIARDEGSGVTITPETGGDYVCAILVRSGAVVNNQTFYPMIRLATETDPTFAPYSNICPISGYDSISITSSGKNMWHGGNVSGISQNRFAVHLPAGTYTISAVCTSSDTDASTCLVLLLNSDLDGIASVQLTRGSRASATFTLSSEATWIRIYASDSYDHSVSDTFSFTDIQIEKGSTATLYDAPTTTTINTPSTIYGGTYDVETGELTVDRALVDLGTLNWTTTITSISNKPRMSSTNIVNEIKKPSSDNSPFNGNCSQYKIVSNNSTFYNTVGVGVSASTGNIFIYDDRYTDAATFKAAMSGVQLAYELASPYTIQLEPHLLNLFEGQNNVSTNGTQISVTYRNGIVARVDDFDAVGESFEALTGKVEIVKTDKAESSALAPVENGATASKAYAVGDYLYRNGTLYRVTSAIASGATFTVDTNITATTVMAEIVRLTQ